MQMAARLIRSSGRPIRRVLFRGDNGLSPQAQQLVNDLVKIDPVLQQNGMQFLLKYKKGAPRPTLDQIPGMQAYLDLLEEVRKWNSPNSGSLLSSHLTDNDYANQGALHRFSKTGTSKIITPVDLFNLALKGTPCISSGSWLTLPESGAAAMTYLSKLNQEEVDRLYLAMDAVWWPYDEGIIPLVEKNFLIELPRIRANNLINRAAKVNADLAGVVDSAHSYGALAKLLALCLFDPMDVANARNFFLAPLGGKTLNTALIEAKLRSLGKITVVDGGFDPLAELSGVHQLVQGNFGSVESRPTDLLVKSGHALAGLLDGLIPVLQKYGQNLVSVNEDNHAVRPAKDFSYYDSTGEYVPVIKPQRWTMAEVEKQYNDASAAERSAVDGTLKTLSSQLEAVIQYASPTVEMQSQARALKDARANLQSATPDVLPDVLSQTNTTIQTVSNTLNTVMAQATSDAQGAGDTAWKANMDTLDSQLKDFTGKVEDARSKITSMDDGTFNPEG